MAKKTMSKKTMSEKTMPEKTMAEKMLAEEAIFQCLRCGHRFAASHTPKMVVERSCPRCASNSVRRMKGKLTS
jgi:Zn finger protein HypA/HybF involved in hydrogenase expression